MDKWRRGRSSRSSSIGRGRSSSGSSNRGIHSLNWRSEGRDSSVNNRENPRNFTSSQSRVIPSSSNSRQHKRLYPIGLKSLQDLMEIDPCAIALKLLNKNSGYTEALNDSGIREDKLCLILNVLSRSLESRASFTEVNNLLALTMENTTFVQTLLQFISKLKREHDKCKEILPIIASIIKRFMTACPLVASSIVSPCVDVSIFVLQQLSVSSNDEHFGELTEAFKLIQMDIEDSLKKVIRPKKVRVFAAGDPPDDICEHSVIPTAECLNQAETPFLRPNIVGGPYQDWQHYVDVHFRLLKEDYFRPFRNGLYHYRFGDPSKKNKDVRIYKNVQLQKTSMEKGDFTYFVKLSVRKGRNLENSKGLMFGNALCVSSDQFETLMIASILNRDDIKNNVIGIKAESADFTMIPGISYTMLESKAYFVAYKYTLKALQNLEVVPLSNYLVKVNENNASPDYLTWETAYEFNIMDVNGGHRRPVLQGIEAWPSALQLSLDESQRRALHGALTRQLAVIQGPPGTGKTFLGLRITESFLNNRSVWNPLNNKPILVVCYTNHALDQFLEGIHGLTNRIIRIGSKSKSEALMAYQINNILRNRKHGKHSVSHLIDSYYDKKRELSDVCHEISELQKVVSHLEEENIVSRETFISHGIHSLCMNSLKGNMYQFLIGNSSSLVLRQESHYSSDNTSDNRVVENSNLEQTRNNLASCEESILDEEIRRQEESGRILDDQFEEIHDNGANVPRFYSKITYDADVGTLKREKIKLLSDLQEYVWESGSETQALYEKKVLEHMVKNKELEIRTLKSCSQLRGTNEECQNLEKKVPWMLSFQQRWKLYNYWKGKLIKEYLKKIKAKELEYKKLNESLSTRKDLAYMALMTKVDVVGMTTTGAAQYCHILHDLAPPIVIVEEAAEILEAHIISALSPRCKHLILIGDHLQLRPKPCDFELETKYKLGISLFERMILSNIKYETLEYQHRMKPSFSDLLVPTIYENLKNHDSVHTFPKIKGVAKDLFFLDHQELECHYDEDESFDNPHEAEFLMGLCRHLLLQGYDPEDVTIITPYLGQFRYIRKFQKRLEFDLCRDVRVSILDNYQGEESNIILLSLVRSNVEEKVGFMKRQNRICVAISRARHGMYIIGNMSQMAKSSQAWEEINQKLINGGNIGPELELQCENHRDVKSKVKSLSDFRNVSPQGGCTRICDFIIPSCGHCCGQCCHVIDMDHKDVKCLRPCERTCDKGHICKARCYNKCPDCKVEVEKVLPCGHTHMVECHIQECDFKCPTMVERTLPHCDHPATVECSTDLNSYPCRVPCPIRLDCGHSCKKSCHAPKDPEHFSYNCYEACERTPQNCELGHKCPQKCFECKEQCSPCKKIVDKKLKCGHVAKDVICGLSDDFECKKKCKKALPCGHHCPKLCYQQCGGCKVKVEKIIPECSHKIKTDCSASPSIKMCEESCIKLLACGHRCQNKCKEPCTTKCRVRVTLTSQKCPKGHSLAVPCHLATLNLPQNSSPTSLKKAVGEYCSELCGTPLSCGHYCQGKCGQCLNGRLHQPCQMPCKRTLVCGHICKEPCSYACPPCQDKCPLKCEHSKCSKQCGVPCVPCKQKCSRKCEHSACTKLCGDECDREPCNFPCSLKLKCGHPCIGLCGEPCPTLCRQCNRDEVTQIIFGDEDEPDARFIQLRDCKHVVESKGLEQWMSQEITGGNGVEIGMKKCPLCQASIYSTRRFHSAILKSFANVKKVKNLHYTKKMKLDIGTLENRLERLKTSWPVEAGKLLRRIGSDRKYKIRRKLNTFSDQEKVTYNFQLDFLESAENIAKKLGSNNSRLMHLTNWVMIPTISVTSQIMEETNCELRRLDISSSVEKIRSRSSNTQIAQILLSIDAHMDVTVKFTFETERKVITLLKEAEKYAGSLGITEKERKEIVNAIGLKQGHWYKCPNGHVYCIGECGGAMERGICPECKSVIGGHSHRLTSGNAVAREMDGATTAAWPPG